MKQRSKLKLNKYALSAIAISSVIIQIVIITYNQVTGYITVENIINALFRLSFASFISIIISIIAFIFNTNLIHVLDKYFDWNKHFSVRIIVELLITIVFASLIISIFTLALFSIGNYQGESVLKVTINNALIISVINIIYVSLLEGIMFYNHWRSESLNTEKLKKENALAMYEALKNQVNPHFLFNSLNTLSSIVRKDSDKAAKFIEEFSMIYRYILETSDKIVVSVTEELSFVKSYFSLIKNRHEDGISLEINVNLNVLDKYLPPFALQIPLENAIKHNVISKSNPLKILIYNDDSNIIVENIMNLKDKVEDSEGIGLKNLSHRYIYLSENIAVFKIVDNRFVAILPLIEAE